MALQGAGAALLQQLKWGQPSCTLIATVRNQHQKSNQFNQHWYSAAPVDIIDPISCSMCLYLNHPKLVNPIWAIKHIMNSLLEDFFAPSSAFLPPFCDRSQRQWRRDGTSWTGSWIWKFLSKALGGWSDKDTGHGWSRLRSGRERQPPMVAVEVRHGTLAADDCGWGPAGNTGRRWSQ